MEKIIDAIEEGMITKDAANSKLFRKQDGKSERYPEKLRNIGYKLDAKNANIKNQMTLERLWHELRNDIAHRNKRPTFEETASALKSVDKFYR